MKPLDPAWLDAQYNNRARVPGYARFLERWAQASALARGRLSRRLDLRYGDGPNETLDLFPSPRANAPVLIFIHGGYWRALDKSDQSFVAPAFVAAGAMVVLPNYELVPSRNHRDDLPSDGARCRLGVAPCGAVRRRSAAHRRGRATRPAGTWPP